MSPRVVLIGPPGAGKTTIGRLVAERLDVPFVDTDEVIEQERGASVSDIFVLDGEPVFRRLEAEVTARALAGDGVVALGGGAPMQRQVADLLAGHVVVFLDVAIADAAGRVGFDRSRPLLAVNPRASWTRMMGERRDTYERLATWIVDTAGRAPDDIADEVAQKLQGVPQ